MHREGGCYGRGSQKIEGQHAGTASATSLMIANTGQVQQHTGRNASRAVSEVWRDTC